MLVNNAGVSGPIGPVEAIDWEEWVETIRINLFGTVLMCRAVIPGMRERGYGKIINLSGGGGTGPRPNFSAYAASKAGVVRFTETLARECRGHRRQRDRPGRAEHAHARRRARRRARPRGRGVHADPRPRRDVLRARDAARRLPRLRRQRRHQRAPDRRAVGRLATLAEQDLDADAYTLRRIVP